MEGQTRTLANGAVGRWKRNAAGNLVFRIERGAPASYLRDIRVTGTRGPNKRPSGRAPSPTYMLAKLKAERGYNRRGVLRDISLKKKGRTLDPNVPKDARLIRKEGAFSRHDVLGIDDGRQKVPITRYLGPDGKTLPLKKGGMKVKALQSRKSLRMSPAVFCQTPREAHPGYGQGRGKGCSYRTYKVAPRSPAQIAAAEAGGRRLAALSAQRGQRRLMKPAAAGQFGGGYWW